MWDALGPGEMLSAELAERREAGYDVGPVEEAVHAALDGGNPDEIGRAHGRLEETVLRADWPFEEPSSLDEIRHVLPPPPVVPPVELDDDDLRDRLLGAWLGRCAGCNLGKPVEGWSRARIRQYLELADAYPIDDYVPVLESTPDGLHLNSCWPETTRGNIGFMARDDAIDWLLPPETASHRNPYREWIGAQIRADMWGYVCPGDPERASLLAFEDASLSHTRNGIYGEIWIAALIATGFVTDEVGTALEISLDHVPPRSRLVEAVRDVVDLHASGLDWEPARDAIEERYGHYGGVHTVNNAALVTAALLWGHGDFTRTIGLAVQGGWDTDCKGATAGSVFGAMHGSGALSARWVDPLNDLVRSSIMGFDHSKVSELTNRTLRLASAARSG